MTTRGLLHNTTDGRTSSQRVSVLTSSLPIYVKVGAIPHPIGRGTVPGDPWPRLRFEAQPYTQDPPMPLLNVSRVRRVDHATLDKRLHGAPNTLGFCK